MRDAVEYVLVQGWQRGPGRSGAWQLANYARRPQAPVYPPFIPPHLASPASNLSPPAVIAVRKYRDVEPLLLMPPPPQTIGLRSDILSTASFAPRIHLGYLSIPIPDDFELPSLQSVKEDSEKCELTFRNRFPFLIPFIHSEPLGRAYTGRHNATS